MQLTTYIKVTLVNGQTITLQNHVLEPVTFEGVEYIYSPYLLGGDTEQNNLDSGSKEITIPESLYSKTLMESLIKLAVVEVTSVFDGVLKHKFTGQITTLSFQSPVIKITVGNPLNAIENLLPLDIFSLENFPELNYF